MMLMFVPTGKPAGANANQENGSGSWRVGYSVQVDSDFNEFVKKEGSGRRRKGGETCLSKA